MALLSTKIHATPTDSPRYRITNEGDQVNIEILEQPSLEKSRADAETRQSARLESASIGELYQLYKESFKPEEQSRILGTLSTRSPRSIGDIQSLLSLFLRQDLSARQAAESSLQRLSPSRDSAFSSFFIGLLRDEDPKLRLFALIGINRLRPEEALKILYEDAEKPFKISEPALRTAPTPANEWQAQFQTLNILASWEGEKVRDLLNKRAKEAPRVAILASTYFWEAALPRLLKWSRSRKDEDRARADAGWRASPPANELRATRKTLWEVLESRRYDREIRHRAAVKLGIASDESDVDRLLKLRSETKSHDIRVLYEAALFASHDPRVVPILKDYVIKHSDPAARAGALTQLSDMLDPAEYRKLLREMAENDPDKENRDRARKTLELSNK